MSSLHLTLDSRAPHTLGTQDSFLQNHVQEWKRPLLDTARVWKNAGWPIRKSSFHQRLLELISGWIWPCDHSAGSWHQQYRVRLQSVKCMFAKAWGWHFQRLWSKSATGCGWNKRTPSGLQGVKNEGGKQREMGCQVLPLPFWSVVGLSLTHQWRRMPTDDPSEVILLSHSRHKTPGKCWLLWGIGATSPMSSTVFDYCVTA